MAMNEFLTCPACEEEFLKVYPNQRYCCEFCKENQHTIRKRKQLAQAPVHETKYGDYMYHREYRRRKKIEMKMDEKEFVLHLLEEKLKPFPSELEEHLTIGDAVTTGQVIEFLQHWLCIQWNAETNIESLRKILLKLGFENFDGNKDLWMISHDSLIFYEKSPVIIEQKPEPKSKMKYDLKKIYYR